MIHAVFNIDPWTIKEEAEFARLSNDADWWVRNCLQPQEGIGGEQQSSSNNAATVRRTK